MANPDFNPALDNPFRVKSEGTGEDTAQSIRASVIQALGKDVLLSDGVNSLLARQIEAGRKIGGLLGRHPAAQDINAGLPTAEPVEEKGAKDA